jgi:hypothetical protein
MNHVNDWYVVNGHMDNTKKWVLTKFFEQTNFLILFCIVIFLSPQMLDKVISKIVTGSHIFNLGGSLTIVFKRQPSFQV